MIQNFPKQDVPPFHNIYINSVFSAASYYDQADFYEALLKYSEGCGDNLRNDILQQGQFDDDNFLRNAFVENAATQAYVWINEPEKKVYIVFRGTGLNPFVIADSKNMNLLFDGLRDALTDLEMVLLSPDIIQRADVMIHSGFWRQFENVRLQLAAKLAEAENNFSDNYEVVICGHSLGGALAAIATAYFSHQREQYPKARFVSHTFGCPRVGNQAFSDYYNEFVSEHWRICNYNDPIPMVPLKSPNTYTHIVGNTVSLYSNLTAATTVVVQNDFRLNFYINDMANFQLVLVLLTVLRWVLFFCRLSWIILQHDPALYCKRLLGFFQL
jgi:pimeloyl-ACP methyl ester carboxylesterase